MNDVNIPESRKGGAEPSAVIVHQSSSLHPRPTATLCSKGRLIRRTVEGLTLRSPELRLATEVGAQDTDRDIHPRWSRYDNSSLKMRDGCAEQSTSPGQRARAR